LKPDFAEAHNDRGGAFSDQDKFDHALAAYEKALSLRPGYPGYMVNVALVLGNLQRHPEVWR
jgi:Flp pilus assembly protein TadD